MLDERIRSRIVDDQKRLTAEGRLPSRAQLEAYCRTFRSRFGPDRLAGLDGEELLETMHAHGNRDSLVYWLEFKDDEEFPAHFGSIAGGSSFKFGIFRRKETGVWVTTGPGNLPRDVTVDEAVEIARKHREQLTRGVERLQQLPALGSDEDYRRLQDDLGRIAPDVSDLAWGHKYFHLMFPEALDDYHNEYYQRFHLIKLLQTPPSESGRYACAGRYVAIAHEFGFPINHLTTILNHLHGRRHRYWRIGTSIDEQPRNRWPLMRDGNCVAIGWEGLGDLSGLVPDKASRERLRQLMHEGYAGTPQEEGRAVSQVFNFVTGIEDGDLVLACDGATVLGVGRVTGGYEYAASSDVPHRRPVDWLSLAEWRMPTPEGLRTTVYELRKQVGTLIEAERRLLDPPPAVPIIPPDERRAGVAPRLDGLPGRIQSVLERKGQAVLYGPPGTGKTYWAERTALDLASYSHFGGPFGGLTEEQKRSILGDEHRLGAVRMCCFHPAYGYEDFIEGYRPEMLDGRIAFALRDGVFKQLCADAIAAPDRKFYLIVDEINRGDIPRIFGELLTIVEKDKRGKPMLLPLSRATFRVPSNVFLIGTMNTADRSIALLDTALRRRFGFVELMPDSGLLGDAQAGGVPLGPWLDALNRRICEHVGRDARNLQVGHSFLLDGGRPVREFARFARVVRDEIIPLLEEYCYEDYDALHGVLGSGLVDAAGRSIRHELFEEARHEELVQALLAPCPEIMTSTLATASGSDLAEEAEAGEDEGVEGPVT